jgi:hypothetical protein
MADSRISQLTPITGANLQANDLFVVARPTTSQNFSLRRDELVNAVASQPYASRTAFIAATVPDDADRIAFFVSGNTYAVVRDLAGPIVQANGQRWAPDGDVTPQHFGAVGDGVTDDTAAVIAASAYSKVVRLPDDEYKTTLTLAGVTSNFTGPGRLITVDSGIDRKRAPNVLNVRSTSDATVPLPGNSVVTGFDGTIASIQAQSVFVSGENTVGDPALSYAGETNYTLSPAASGYYTQTFFQSGKNKSPFNTGGRTGYAVDSRYLSHAGKGDAWQAFWFANISAADSNILQTHGAPATGLYGGAVNALTDDVIIQNIEVTISDNGNDVVGKGLVLNLKRDNATAAKNQFWVGSRTQSIGAEKVDAAYQAVGGYKNGIDLTVGTMDRPIAMKADQFIHFDCAPNKIYGALAWAAGQVVAIGDIRETANNVYEATTAGTTGATEPTHTSGSVSDGGVTWLFLAARNFPGYAVSSAGHKVGVTGGRINVVYDNLPVMTYNTTSILSYYQLRPAVDNTTILGGASARWAQIHGAQFRTGPSSTLIIQGGNGSPEGALTAPIGSLWLRANGGAGTTLYVKESGVGNTGWVAK